ncbi:citrate lyase subunit beta / citryl-CoA lyase [Agromyces sp. CF514]|uniref:HpcH/HpaI aldolase/citrate lyase family protein n=1 Tax=Agromyces sp. CF514 TaxID=1881031 RepID=UPI0008F1DDE5|nr:CoA ester lyase [Agromyces sp. CF514]SFR88448.1 citrate lyase subunit beta / citryl-CoA lyase [Agromyces sp. CF514]
MTRPPFRFGPALLFCPGDRPDRFAKAFERADAVILDLEDAVAPAARDDARRAVAASDLDPERVIVRVNPASSDAFAADLAMLADTGYRTVMLAKCEGTADLVELEPFEVIALCETARGVLAAEAVAALPNVSALMWGAEDLVASLGGSSSRHDDGGRRGEYRGVPAYARAHVQLAAAAHGAAAIDAVHLDIADLEGLGEEARDAAALGFAATACIHPSQVEVVREAYRPGAEQLEWARAVLAAGSGEQGVFAFRGTMVDEPVLRQAEAVVRRAAAASGS